MCTIRPTRITETRFIIWRTSYAYVRNATKNITLNSYGKDREHIH